MLSGKLVTLRPVAMSDLDRYVEWINDPEVTQFLASGAMFPFSREQEEEWLRQAVHHTRPPFMTLAIEVNEGARHIGTVSLHDFDNVARKACLGIMIGDKTCWNRGYGTDAITTILRFAFAELGLNRVWLEVNEDNARGIACYRKCGFVEEGRLRQDRFRRGRFRDTLLMAVLTDDFRELHGA